jgi:hypothetical protein
MKLFSEIILKDSVEIEASVEKIWQFFDNIESNYIAWHPEAHVSCKWLKGKPHEEGSIAYFEEILDGKLRKIKVLFTKVKKFKRVESKSLFPLSIFHPKGIYIFESENNNKSRFTAINYMRVPRIFNKRLLSLINATEKHMKEEGINLKRIIEHDENKI